MVSRPFVRSRRSIQRRFSGGAKPADLPLQQTPKLNLVINLSTAKAPGLTIPEHDPDHPLAGQQRYWHALHEQLVPLVLQLQV
jgi:hypothetical protein